MIRQRHSNDFLCDMAHLAYYKEIRGIRERKKQREMWDLLFLLTLWQFISKPKQWKLTLIMMLSLSCMASMNSRATSNSGLIQNLISSWNNNTHRDLNKRCPKYQTSSVPATVELPLMCSSWKYPHPVTPRKVTGNSKGEEGFKSPIV